MLTCKELAKVIASDEFADAGWKQRLGVRLHLLMCRHCRRYRTQLRAIGAAARQLFGRSQEEDQATLRRLERAILLDPGGSASSVGYRKGSGAAETDS